MNIKVEEKKLNIKINQETKKIEVSIIDSSDKIDLNLTNYDDREVRNLIQENTEQIEELDNNKADRTEIKTKTSELINDSNFVSDSNYVHTDNNYTTVEKEKLSNLENYDDTEVRQLIEGKQPRGNYLTEETDPTVPSHVKSITQQNITNWNNKADMSDIPDVSNFASKTELGSETAARENADIGLQEQIDAITSSSDVKDIVGTYIELQNYDTSTLGNDDIVKVLQDNTHNKAMTYYRWVILGSTGSWQYVGQEGPYYTKSETETLLNNKQDEITSSNKIDSDLVNDTNQTNKFVTQIEKTTWNTEIENLHEEDELLKRNLQTTTGSGEEVTLEKTTELDFVKPPLPRGNTEQDTTTGKNLLNTIDAGTTTTNGVTYYRNNGVYYLSGTNTKTDAVWILPNTQKTNLPEFEIGQTYTMSFDGDISDNIYIQLNAIKTSTGTQYNLGSIRRTVPSATFTIDSNYLRSAQLFIGVQPTKTNVNCNFSVQIEKGAVATSYEPYTGGISSPNPDYPQEIRNVTGNVEVTISNENNTESKTLTASLGDIELCKIGNYQDYFYKDNGKWYKYNVINKLVLNGSENWGLQSINSYGIANFQKSQPIDTIAGQANLSFCDKFSPQTTLISVTKDIGYFLNTAKVLFIRFNSTIANTAATFKTWLSQHNVTLYYVLGEATSTEITDTTLISQLEEISKTLSYQGQTNITSNTIAMFDVEAYQDLKIILDEKYVKPSTGIPKTDLASTVQTSLGKADTAVQKDGGSATQTVSLSSGTGTTPLAVKSKSTSSYISFSNSSTWIGSIGVSSDKHPVFYNGAGYTLAYTTDIPTKTSDLTNDSGYITSYTETDPTVPSHVKNITQANITSWNNKSDFSGNYNDLTNKPTIPSEVTESTVSGWGFTKNTGTYSKPSGGIPKTDLESSVQTSLGKADTALQSHQDISGKADKTALQDISINTNSPMPSFDDMEVLDTYEFDISDTNYHPIYTLPNNGLNYIDTDITVAYRLTVTGTNISEVADIIDVWHNPISSPLTTVLNRTLSTSAATSGVRYLRAVYPTSAYLNDTTYPLGQEIASYNATARHIKIEVFKQPSNITWKSASENSIYINTTYNGSSSVTLYTTRGWIFRSPQSFVATSASSATYVSSYEPATIGSGAIKTGATAISANHFVYLADNGLVYDISNTTANISAEYKKVGVLTTAVAKNTAISTTYFRTVAQLTSTMIGTISHDTLALGRMVFLRCTIDSSGNIHSNNYLATSMSAGYTWLPIGVATASNTINMDTRGQHFYTLDLNGKLTHLDGIEIATGS